MSAELASEAAVPGLGAPGPTVSRAKWLCLVAAVGAIVPALLLLSWIWGRSEYLGHAYLIPAASAWLAWLRRDALKAAIAHSRAPASGPIFVLAAVLIETAAVAAEVSSIAGLSIPLVLAATCYAVGGSALLRLAALPIGFLVLMVPPPGFLQDMLLIQLKAMVISASVSLLQLAGYTITAVGNRVLLPDQELFVAHACSGLTSLVTLSPLAVVVAYFRSHGIWRRAAIVASILPLAVLGNIVRVTLTIVLVTSFGMQYAEGALHESFGLATFALGTLGLLAIARCIR